MYIDRASYEVLHEVLQKENRWRHNATFLNSVVHEVLKEEQNIDNNIMSHF